MEEHEVGIQPDNGAGEVTCIHHWLIEPPNGPTSMGVCKRCGAMREFDNQLPTKSAATPQTTAQSSDEQAVHAGQQN
jgi:hypothetical protein